MNRNIIVPLFPAIETMKLKFNFAQSRQEKHKKETLQKTIFPARLGAFARGAFCLMIPKNGGVLKPLPP
jgi:hypothetical protein